MRICELIPAPSIRGAERLALELRREFAARGHEIDVVALDPADANPATVTSDEIAVGHCADWILGRKVRRLVVSIGLIQRGRYDVVHTHSFFPNLYARLAAALPGVRKVPIVVTLHSMPTDFEPSSLRIERMLGAQTAAVVAVNPDQYQEYIRHFPRRRAVYIPNGVRKLAEQPSLASSKPHDFAVVGQITPRKELDTVLRGFGDFVAKGKRDVRLHVIGPEVDQPYGSVLRRLGESVARGLVTFHGPLAAPFDEIPIDVLVHAALRETHPMAVLEAAARGIPVICTRERANAGAIGNACTTFEPRDSGGLSQALVDVYDNWPAAVALATTAWHHVPDIRDCADAYERLFGTVLETGGAGPHGGHVAPQRL